jgi:hypothetical protein
MLVFYRGLKDGVKGELACMDRPADDDLAKLEERAIRIDNQLYERALEKKGKGGFGGYSSGKGKGNGGLNKLPKSESIWS